MNKFVARAMIVASLGLAAPAAGAVNGFAIVNQTGGALSDVALRRVGDREWQPLARRASPPGPAPAPTSSMTIAPSTSAPPSPGPVRSCGAGSICAT